MPWLDVIWTEANRAHLAEHGVTPEEVEQVLARPDREMHSASSGRPLVFGYTGAGRYLAVVYEPIDEVTVYPLTAYEVED